MFLSEWREFPSAPCLAGGGKKNLMTASVSMLLKSRASLTCFRVCFLPGRAKDVSAPGSADSLFHLRGFIQSEQPFPSLLTGALIAYRHQLRFGHFLNHTTYTCEHSISTCHQKHLLMFQKSPYRFRQIQRKT